MALDARDEMVTCQETTDTSYSVAWELKLGRPDCVSQHPFFFLNQQHNLPHLQDLPFNSN